MVRFDRQVAWNSDGKKWMWNKRVWISRLLTHDFGRTRTESRMKTYDHSELHHQWQSLFSPEETNDFGNRPRHLNISGIIFIRKMSENTKLLLPAIFSPPYSYSQMFASVLSHGAHTSFRSGLFCARARSEKRGEEICGLITGPTERKLWERVAIYMWTPYFKNRRCSLIIRDVEPHRSDRTHFSTLLFTCQYQHPPHKSH